ncbi:hypothetical protein D3C85_377470 [compost metagenome]
MHSPEQKMWIACYFRLVDDARAFVRNDAPPCDGEYNDLHTAYWSIILADNDFQTVCHRAGFDPSFEREKFLKRVDEWRKKG